MHRYLHLMFAGLLATAGSAAGCSSDATTTTTTTGSDSVPAVFQKFGNGVTVTRDGNFIVLQTANLPDHKSAYWPTSDSRYQAYNGTNPNYSRAGTQVIIAQQLTFRIPVSPVMASNHAATPLGPIGIAVNGVSLFNQYNGQNNPLTVEINTFDQWNGHPTPTNMYHYHSEPTWITSAKGTDALIGFLLDGFPVYGPKEGTKTITNADLDAYHGHVAVTADYPAGIYHYHITSTDPYINGSGFYGAAGTVAQ